MAEKSLEIQNTLVRYNNPTLVVKHEDKKGEREVRCLLRNFGFLINFILSRTFQRVHRSETLEKRLRKFSIPFFRLEYGKVWKLNENLYWHSINQAHLTVIFQIKL